jgi:hypothetical protein
MIIPIIESMVYAMASAAARTPARRRQYQAPRRVISGAAADLLIEQLCIERERVAVLRQAHDALALQNLDLSNELAAAKRIFIKMHGHPNA